MTGRRTSSERPEEGEQGRLVLRRRAGETVPGKLLAAGGSYLFGAGKFFNLEGSDFIKGHSDVTGKEIAYAVRKAIAS